MTKIIFSGNVQTLDTCINDEISESKSTKMKPNIVLKAHLSAIEQGKTLGKWPEEAIKERGQKQLKQERSVGAGLFEVIR